MKGGARLVVAMWFAALAVIFWASAKRGGLPPASAVGGAAVMYSLLIGLASVPGAEGLAGAFSAGWTLSLLYRATRIQSGPVPGTKAQPAKSNVVPLPKRGAAA